MKKHYNKRWLEQHWDARQLERLEHIGLKSQLKEKMEVNEDEESKHGDSGMRPDFEG